MHTVQSLAKDFRKHLEEEGFQFDMPPVDVEKLLETEMGIKRYRKYCYTAADFHKGSKPIDCLYREIKTPKEAALLFSHQSDAACRAGAWLASKLLELKQERIQFADLGCSTGYLARWIKRLIPTSNAFGFDSVDGFIRLAKTINKDVSFSKWDYFSKPWLQDHKFNVLVTSLGMDFPHHIPVNRIKPTAFPILKHWRSACNTGSKLFGVFRIGQQHECEELIDAATRAGWTLHLESSAKVQMNSNEKMPALTFTATEPATSWDRSGFEAFWNHPSVKFG